MTALAPRRTRRLAATVALVALVLGTSACNAGRPPAAIVRDIDISAQRVDDLVAAFAEADPEGAGTAVEGEGRDTYSTGAAANLLAFLMTTAAGAAEADDEGLDPVEATEAETSLATALGGSDAERGTATLDALPDDTRGWLVDLWARSEAFKGQLAGEATPDPAAQEAQARSLYDTDPSAFTTICLRLIAVAEAELPDVQARLDAGEDFGDVSADVSGAVDPDLAAARGGDQCALLSQFQQQLDPTAFEDIAGAGEGGVVGPYQYDDQGNVVIVEIRSAEVPPFEEVSESIIASLPADDGSQAYAERTSEILGADDTRIDPRFGSWDDEAGTVVPPPGSRTPDAEG